MRCGSTPKGGCRSRHRSARCSRATGSRDSIAIRRSTGRRSMPAATRCSKEIETLIARFSPYSEEREQLSAALYGTSEVLKIDGEGRAILTEPLKSHAGIKDEIAFVGLGHKFQIWEPGTLSRGTRGGHREGPRAQEAARLPGSGGRSAWSTGMMTSSDSGHAVAGGLARHIPVLIRPAVELLAVRSGGVYVDATFGAGGYTPRNPRRGELQRHRPRSRPERDRARRRSGASVRRTARAGGGQVLQSGGGDARLRLRRRRRRGPRPRRLLDAARPGRARIFLPPRRSARHAHGLARDRARPTSWRRPPSAISRPSSRRSAKSATRAPSPAPSSPPARDAPIRTTRALADIVTRIVHARPGAIHPATRTFQALRIFVNEELAELADGTGRGRAGAQARRPAGGGGFPLARGPHRQILPHRAQPPQRAFAPSSGRGASRRHVPRADQAADRAGRGGDQRQSARALGQAAGGRAHRCAASTPAHPRARFRACRRCATCRTPGIGAAR